MRNAVFFFFVSILMITSCNSQQNDGFAEEKSVLDFYRQYSAYTDPGKYEYLYRNLPDSLPELCQLIRAQFLHIVAEYPSYRYTMAGERRFDINKYLTVETILQGLLHYDSTGLTLNREPEDRLVLGCQNYALLLSSILKFKGVPTRVRYGHATYLVPDFHANHVICEVWNIKEKRWMLVDPALNMIDFDRDMFDFRNEAWLQMQKSEIDLDQFGFPVKYSGPCSIAGKITHDLAPIFNCVEPFGIMLCMNNVG